MKRWFRDGRLWFGVFVVVLVTVPVAASWYKAGVQQEVYRRQGVEMSRWELFMGAQPVERYLVPAEKK